ncbi:MAG: XRE family transcriptional regulator [Nitrospirota bacterium]
MKPLNFIGSSLDDLRNFPDEARKAAGFELYSVQCGLEPNDWKPMTGIGRGVAEKRINMMLKLLAGDINKLEDSIMKKPIVKSSGNVFLDLGFSPEEAAILQMRSEIMADLRKIIKSKKLTQVKAADVLGISQSRVSDLIRGKWENFSLEMLIALATRAGVHISLKRAA